MVMYEMPYYFYWPSNYAYKVKLHLVSQQVKIYDRSNNIANDGMLPITEYKISQPNWIQN